MSLFSLPIDLIVFCAMATIFVVRERDATQRAARRATQMEDRIWILEQNLRRLTAYSTKPCPLCGLHHPGTQVLPTKLPKSPLLPLHRDGIYR